MYRLIILVLVFILGGCQKEAAEQPQAQTEAPPVLAKAVDATAAIAATVNHPDRSETDRARDDKRRPAAVMGFARFRPGTTVLDFFAGGGYYTELLARLVGEDGKVISHNPQFFYDNYDDGSLAKRLANNRLANVVEYKKEFDDLGLEENSLDAIFAGMIIHDLQRMTPDPDATLLQLFEALRSGGFMLITDHAAPEGTGNAMALESGGEHRIEDAFVITQMEAAGFELATRSDLLHVAEDDRSKAFFRMDGAPTDRFVLLFKKP